RGRRIEVVAPEEICAVVEQADVHEPWQRPGPPVPGARLHRGGEIVGEFITPEARRHVEQPPRSRELPHPDAGEHHHVEAGTATFEVDHEKLALLVRRPRQHLRLDPYAGMLRLELGEEARDGIDGAKDLGVLEHESDRPLPFGRRGAGRYGEDQPQGGAGATGPPGGPSHFPSSLPALAPLVYPAAASAGRRDNVFSRADAPGRNAPWSPSPPNPTSSSSI